MKKNELRRQHAEIGRLHSAIVVQGRELLLMRIRNEDLKLVHQIMDQHVSQFWTAIGLYEDMVQERDIEPRQTYSQQGRSVDPSVPRFSVKLPDFHLPSFDGSADNWLKWKETFQSMIHAKMAINTKRNRK